MSEQSTKVNIDKLTGNERISRKERYDLLFEHFRFDKNIKESISRDVIHSYLKTKQVNMDILHKRVVYIDDFNFWLRNIP